MEQIELVVNGKKALYHYKTKTVTFTTRYGVVMQCEVPKNWGLIRVFQFMESLVRASDGIV